MFTSSPSSYAKIYKAAKDKNEIALKRVLRIANINLLDRGIIAPPIAKLAFENDKDSVDFLLKSGGSLEWALFGYAWGGNKVDTQLIFEQVSKETNSTPQALLWKMAGFAQGGHTLDLFAILNSLDTMENNDFLKVALEYITFFSALAEKKMYVASILDVVERCFPEATLVYIKAIARGLAQGGHLTTLNLFIKQVINKYSNEFSEILRTICAGLAQGGQNEVLSEVLQQIFLERPSEYFVFIEVVTDNFAYCNYKFEVYTILEHGFREQVHNFQRLLEKAANGFIWGGNTEEAFILSESNLAKVYYSPLSVYVLKNITEYEKANKRRVDKALVLKTISLLKDIHSRVELLQDLDIYDASELIPRAAEFNTLMHQHNLSYNQLLGWTQLKLRIYLLAYANIFVNIIHTEKSNTGLTKKDKAVMTKDLYLTIADFLFGIKPDEICDLSNKLFMEVYPNRFQGNEEKNRLYSTDRVAFFSNLKKNQRLLVEEVYCLNPAQQNR